MSKKPLTKSEALEIIRDSNKRSLLIRKGKIIPEVKTVSDGYTRQIKLIDGVSKESFDERMKTLMLEE